MTESIYSPSWYRVSELRPSLRDHAHLNRQQYRGDRWYVLQDRAAGNHHRLTPATYFIIGLMNGSRTVEDIWKNAVERLQDDAPTQDEIITLLGQLHSSDVLRCDVTPDALELFRRYQDRRKTFWKQRISSPLSVRIPLWDPDRFLRRTLPWVSLLLGRVGALLWLAVVGYACMQAGVHWNEITGDIIDKALAPASLLTTLLIYPLVKALHELGHAYVTRYWGGEVHELGVMFLVFVPVPYVDASAAWSFREKRRRMLVGAAGIGVEVFLASVALLVWLAVEPGVIRTMAYSVMLICGVSTVLFNGNPLLRFDGYHVFADAIEVPNLGVRSNKYLLYVLQRYVLGIRKAASPVTAPGERFWFSVYGIAALAYRLFIMVAIVVFVASKFFFVGVLIALWALVSVIAVPSWKALKFFVSNPVVSRRRGRAAASGLFVLLIIAFLIAVVPVPLRTVVEGVVWMPDKAMVRPGTGGSIVRALLEPGSEVEAGDALFVLEDPILPLRVEQLESRLEELNVTLMLYRETDLIEARKTREQILEVVENLRRAKERVDSLIVRAAAKGTLVIPRNEDLPGRYVRQGEIIAYVLDSDEFVVRAVVPQHAVTLVQQRTRGVQLRVVGDDSHVIESEIERQVPGAMNKLPNAALGSLGGGEIPVDPRAGDALTPFQGVFQFDLRLPHASVTEIAGNRVVVRFDHGMEPVVFQVYRSVRRLLLRQFNV